MPASISIEEQRALFVKRAALFAMTPEEKAREERNKSKPLTRIQIEELDWSVDKDTVYKEGTTHKDISVAKEVRRPKRFVSLLDEEVRLNRLRREGKINEVREMEAAIALEYQRYEERHSYALKKMDSAIGLGIPVAAKVDGAIEKPEDDDIEELEYYREEADDYGEELCEYVQVHELTSKGSVEMEGSE